MIAISLKGRDTLTSPSETLRIWAEESPKKQLLNKRAKVLAGWNSNPYASLIAVSQGVKSTWGASRERISKSRVQSQEQPRGEDEVTILRVAVEQTWIAVIRGWLESFWQHRKASWFRWWRWWVSYFILQQTHATSAHGKNTLKTIQKGRTCYQQAPATPSPKAQVISDSAPTWLLQKKRQRYKRHLGEKSLRTNLQWSQSLPSGSPCGLQPGFPVSGSPDLRWGQLRCRWLRPGWWIPVRWGTGSVCWNRETENETANSQTKELNSVKALSQIHSAPHYRNVQRPNSL